MFKPPADPFLHPEPFSRMPTSGGEAAAPPEPFARRLVAAAAASLRAVLHWHRLRRPYADDLPEALRRDIGLLDGRGPRHSDDQCR